MGIVGVLRGRLKVTEAQRDKGFGNNFTECHKIKTQSFTEI